MIPLSWVYQTYTTEPMTFRNRYTTSQIYEEPIVDPYSRGSRIIERVSRPRQVSWSISPSTDRYIRKTVRPSVSYETGRRLKEIRTHSPVINYQKSIVVNGIESSPVIERYETKIEKFHNPFEEKYIVDKNISHVLH